jgi:hypothetical protein
MAKPKKPPPTFEVEFAGAGLYPEKIPIGTLSRALAAVQRLAMGDDPVDDEEDAAVGTDGKFALIQVKRGSAIYQFAARAPELSLLNLRATGEVLSEPETIGDREFILNPLDELSAVSRSLDSPIVVREPGRDGAILARIEPSTYSDVSSQLLIRGDTTLYGKVERVGGATERKCGLRIDGRNRMLICKVDSAQTARELGQKLYQKVAVKGTALWLKTNWRVIGFTAKEIYQPRPKPVDELLETLRDAGGSDWDEISDPQAFLEEISGDR